MKAIPAVFLLLCLTGIVWVNIISSRGYVEMAPPRTPAEQYVRLTADGFGIGDSSFYPMVINFPVTLRVTDSSMWPAVYIGYLPGHRYTNDRPDSNLAELRHYLDLVHDLGFNTVRLVGIAEPDVMDRQTGRISFKVSRGTDHNATLYLKSEDDYNRYFNAIDLLLQQVDKAGLKAILTTKVFRESPQSEAQLARLTRRLREQPSVLAFDFFNEPLYFDSLDRKDKTVVYYITQRWQKIAKANSPHHLTTIGLACQRELFEWDPNLMNVDFISFHPYEYEPDQVRNELYWYHRFVDKPWIIGETGIPADNDSVPYDDQVRFARKTLIQNLNCGGRGYSWWQFKDVNWGSFHQNHLGVLDAKGATTTSSGGIVQGTPKPVTREIGSFNTGQQKGPCICPPNHYNFGSHTAFRLSGRLTDRDGNPLEGAGVLAWDEHWVNHHFTTTRPDGSFELYSEYPFHHWMVSATRHEMIRKDCQPDTAFRAKDGIPTVRLGTIRLKRLDIPGLFAPDAI